MTLIQSAKLNGVEPLAWLTDVLERVVSGRTKRMNLTRCCRGTGVRSTASNWLRLHDRQPRNQAERLLARLQAALPLPARVTPELAATLQAKNTKREIPSPCSITWISYAGDEGGIVCRLDFGQNDRNGSLCLDHPPALRPPPAAGSRYRRLPETPRQTLAAPADLIYQSAKQSSKMPGDPLPLRLRSWMSAVSTTASIRRPCVSTRTCALLALDLLARAIAVPIRRPPFSRSLRSGCR